jgi:hypothetical protein
MYPYTTITLECPVCYGQIEEQAHREFDPPYEEGGFFCNHGCTYGEFWCGQRHWFIKIRDHQFEFFSSWSDTSQERKDRKYKEDIIILAARKALIEDLREKSKA